MTADDIVKLALGLALAFSVLGISIQLMRLLGNVNGALYDLRYLGREVINIVQRFKNQYEKLEDTLAGLGDTINNINTGFLQPVSNLANTVGNLATMAREKIVGEDKNN